jgi:hypothetical protein
MMRDTIKRIAVPCLFCALVAGVWTVGSIKAELDLPPEPSMRVDPDIVRRALLAEKSYGSASGIHEHRAALQSYYLFTG